VLQYLVEWGREMKNYRWYFNCEFSIIRGPYIKIKTGAFMKDNIALFETSQTRRIHDEKTETGYFSDLSKYILNH